VNTLPVSFTHKVRSVIQLNAEKEESLRKNYITINHPAAAIYTLQELSDTFSDLDLLSDSKSYTAAVETGYELNSDGQRPKQAPYITTHFNRTEDTWTTDVNEDIALSPLSKCTMQALWDWTSTAEPGKWGKSQEVYRFRRQYSPVTTPSSSGTYENGYPVVTTKSKVRGRGKALQMRFTSAEGFACEFLGYSVSFTGNTKV